jgi:hypothetical protein
MMMKRLLSAVVVMLAVGSPIFDAHAVKASVKLKDAAPSPEALIDRFLTALKNMDREALTRLRVDEEEYTKAILLGTVPKGQPLRKWPDDVCHLFWGFVEDKSQHYQDYLLNRYGGRTYTLKSLTYEKGTQTYATHTAYKQLRLELTDPDGNPVNLATGSIAEVGGQYKFISFIRD